MLPTRKKLHFRSQSTNSFQPKPYQLTSMIFGLEREAAGFFLAPGLGKTAIALHIFHTLKEEGLIDELLVVATRRIMYNVWPAEIKKWNLPYSHKLVHGGGKIAALNSKTDIKLINYEGLLWLATQKTYLRKKVRRMIVFDESSKMRNHGTKRFKTTKRKILPKFERRYILTGSPAPKGLMNIFAQTYLLDYGKRLGKFITHFRTKYFSAAGFGGYSWKLNKGADKKIFRKISDLIIRFGDDQLDMPPLTIVDRRVELDKKSRKIYDELEQEFVAQIRKHEIVASNAAVASGMLRQIANGGIYTHEPKNKWREVHVEKCEELVELLDELQGEPALIGYEFKHDAERLQKYFRKHAPQYANTPMVSSSTGDREMAKLIKKWNRGDLVALAGNTATLSHGLNLQESGGIVIFFCMPWDLEAYEQFIRRIWRQGQKRRVIVYRILATNTVDEVVSSALKTKDRTQQSLLKAMEKHYNVIHTIDESRTTAVRKAGKKKLRRA